MPNCNSPSGKAVQMPAFATSKHGLGREAWAALLKVRPGLNAPKTIRGNYLGIANQTVG